MALVAWLDAAYAPSLAQAQQAHTQGFRASLPSHSVDIVAVKHMCPGRRATAPGAGHHLQGGSDMPKGTRGRAPCSIEGCGRPCKARGWCPKHYTNWVKTGDPTLPSRPTTEERFWAKVDKNGPTPLGVRHLGPCWIWTASLIKGYGRFTANGRNTSGHRYAYELLTGPVPPSLDLDHLCRVRACVNPAHLEPVTRRENVLRGVSLSAQRAKQTHCKDGHEFTPENTYLSKRNERTCLACRAAWRPANKRRGAPSS